MIKPIHVLLGAGAALGLWAVFHKTSRFKGDDAKVGDDVRVPVSSLPPGSLPAGLPQGVGMINVRVSAIAPETLDGLITSYVVQEQPVPLILPLPTPVGPVRINRSAVVTVVRGGQAIA